MRSFPWIATVVAIVVVANPVGLGFLRALWSSEQLARNIATPIVALAAILLAVAAFIESAVRRRRLRDAGDDVDRGQ